MSLLLTSCSSWERTTAVGVGSGAAIGASYGVVGNYDTKSTIILSATGAVIGAGVGFAIHKLFKEKKYSESFEKVSDPSLPEEAKKQIPILLSPKIRRRWVPPKTEGKKRHGGYWMYEIERPMRWADEQPESQESP